MELNGTVRPKPGCWKSAIYILSVELVERIAFIGIKSNLVNYLTGPLGLTTAAAAGSCNAWLGAADLSPLVGAFIADAFLGSYTTIMYSSLLYILGLGFLSLSSALHFASSALNVGFCFFSLYLVAFAQGGHRPCMQAFGADQFDDGDETECKAKSSFFNWWGFSMLFGSLVAFLFLSYIQENISWELGFGIPCFLLCFALLVFSLGTQTYRLRVSRDERNPFVRIGLAFVRAVRHWRGTKSRAVSFADEAGETLLKKATHPFKFLDNALLSTDGIQDNNNKVCSPGDIEDAKAILKLVPLWSSCLGYALVYSQISTLFTKQGAVMGRYITSTVQVPAASLQSFVTLSILVFLPVYDRIFIPIARAISNNPPGITVLQRIGTGLFFSTISMVVAAFVERKRLATDVVMSIWWLVPQYLLCGITYAFAAVGLQEFFYDQMPKDLKSIGPALYLSIFGIGSFLSSFLISAIEKSTTVGGQEGWFSDDLNQGHIDYFYWLLAGINVVAFGAYVYFAKSYRTTNFLMVLN